MGGGCPLHTSPLASRLPGAAPSSAQPRTAAPKHSPFTCTRTHTHATKKNKTARARAPRRKKTPPLPSTANAESLADALRGIIAARATQLQFQLIVITHDDAFASRIGAREEGNEFLWRVTKDDQQHTRVEQEQIVESV